MNFLIKFLITYLIVITVSFAEEIKVFDFTETELSNLEVRKVRGADNKTIYTIGSNENGNFLKAVADNGASGLGKEIKINASVDEAIIGGIVIKVGSKMIDTSIRSKLNSLQTVMKEVG